VALGNSDEAVLQWRMERSTYVASDGHEASLIWQTTQPEAAADVTALICPGMSAPVSFYARLMVPMARVGIRAVVMEWRGQGKSNRSPKTDNWSYRELVELDLPAAISRTRSLFDDGSRLVLLGHSLGGQLGTIAALESDLVDAVILVASQTPHWTAYGRRRPQLFLAAFVLFPFMAWLLGYHAGKSLSFGGNEPRGVIQCWCQCARSGMFAAPGGKDYEDILRKRRPDLPFLTIAVEGDDAAPLQAVLEFARKLASQDPAPNVQHLALQGQVRNAHFDWARSPNGEAVSRLIRTFLDSNLQPPCVLRLIPTCSLKPGLLRAWQKKRVRSAPPARAARLSNTAHPRGGRTAQGLLTSSIALRRQSTPRACAHVFLAGTQRVSLERSRSMLEPRVALAVHVASASGKARAVSNSRGQANHRRLGTTLLACLLLACVAAAFNFLLTYSKLPGQDVVRRPVPVPRGETIRRPVPSPDGAPVPPAPPKKPQRQQRPKTKRELNDKCHEVDFVRLHAEAPEFYAIVTDEAGEKHPTYLEFLSAFQFDDKGDYSSDVEWLLRAEPFKSNAFAQRRTKALVKLIDESWQILKAWHEKSSKWNPSVWKFQIGFEGHRPPRVLLFEGFWWLHHFDGRPGQTLGDITIWVDYYLAMVKAGAVVEGFPMRQDTYPKTLVERAAYLESFDMIMVDYMALDHLRSKYLMQNVDVYRKVLVPRLFIEDAYGTSQEFDQAQSIPSMPLYCCAHLESMSRYLVMLKFFHESNTFIGDAAVITGKRHIDLLLDGFVPPVAQIGPSFYQAVEKLDSAGIDKPREFAALLWGKGLNKFPHRVGTFRKEINLVADHIKLYSTVFDKPVGPFSMGGRSQVENLGPQSFEDMQALLDSVTLVVNPGVSAIGHLAIEAMAHGAVVWVHDRPICFAGSKPITTLFTSTHPHLEIDPGPPMLRRIDLADPAVVDFEVQRLRRFVDADDNCRSIHSDEDRTECQKFKFFRKHGTPIREYTMPSLLLRINNLLHNVTSPR
ncbi:Uncharacterized protein SCF082_LOCUS1153, partial [Durusdinium trenchii]